MNNINNNTTRGNYNKISLDLRNSIIRMYTNGVTKTKISQDLNIARSSVTSIVKNFIQNGTTEAGNKGGPNNTKCTDEMRQLMEEILQDDCTKTLSYLQKRIEEKFDVKLCLSTIRANLKIINFSLKEVSRIPLRRNDANSIEARFQYSQRFDFLSGEYLRSRFIYVDEAGFCVSMRRNRGWSRIGTSANIIVPALKARNFSVCAAISIQGVLINKIRDRSYNSASFLDFINDLLDVIDEKNKGTHVLIMDNATIHKGSDVRRAIEERAHILEYLPPYSPFLNPIENCFSKWKSFVKSLSCNNEEELINGIHEGFNYITTEDCEGWLRNMLHYLNESRLKRIIDN